MIIDPRTITTSAMERTVLTASLKSFVKSERRRLQRLSKPRHIEETEFRIAYAEDLITKINGDRA